MKRVSDFWMDYLRRDISGSISSKQVDDIRATYYAGVTRGVAMMRKATQLPPAEAGAAIHAIFSELSAFGQAMAAAPAPAPEPDVDDEPEDEEESEATPA